MTGSVPVFKEPIGIDLYWYEPNWKRDPDNLAAGVKYVLDALVLLNKIPNDTRKWVKSITHHFPDPDPVNPRVVVQINTA